MSWLDQLQPASWRNVPFHVDTVDVEAGDNVVLREYPFQDLPTVFRMGEAAEEIRLSAYVIGADWQAQRDALREVLTGDGVLIHPSAGAIRCWCNGKYTVKEAPTSEGGMARFDLRFVRAEPRRYPRALAATAPTSALAAQGFDLSLMDLFAQLWSLGGQPGWVVERLLAHLTAGLGGVWQQLVPLLTRLARGGSIGDEWAALVTGRWQALSGDLEGLARQPAALARSVADWLSPPADLPARLADDPAQQDAWLGAYQWAFDLPSKLPQTDFETVRQPLVGVSGGGSAPGGALAGLALYGTGVASPAMTQSSPARRVLEQQRSVANLLLQGLGTSALVRVCAVSSWTSTPQARALRSALSGQCLALQRAVSGLSPAPVRGSAAELQQAIAAASAASGGIGATGAGGSSGASSAGGASGSLTGFGASGAAGSDSSAAGRGLSGVGDCYAAIARMQSALLADFAARSAMGQPTTLITLQTVLPVWALSYRLYGSTDYVDEILAANPVITHPLLVPAGVPLTVVQR